MIPSWVHSFSLRTNSWRSTKLYAALLPQNTVLSFPCLTSLSNVAVTIHFSLDGTNVSSLRLHWIATYYQEIQWYSQYWHIFSLTWSDEFGNHISCWLIYCSFPVSLIQRESFSLYYCLAEYFWNRCLCVFKVNGYWAFVTLFQENSSI